ncbi:hypothetical protein GCM10007414_34410 [Agarivorans gilvus]|uniref:Uncharacterized protein n=1 Tax=Agarivorans gilvus TaxID=680279 RepID=A0ABQ1I7N2_9ALTE|nr:hypothetical protein GCM10007414_34410 [Agarivorans gilvus]
MYYISKFVVKLTRLKIVKWLIFGSLPNLEKFNIVDRLFRFCELSLRLAKSVTHFFIKDFF